MGWEGVGVILTAIGGVIGFSILWGKMTNRIDNVELKQGEHSRHHEDHYNHAAKADVHWTTRERNELTKTLDRIEAQTTELLRRSITGGAK